MSLSTFLFHVRFLTIFLTAADLYKNVAISAQLRDRRPECVNVKSFSTSILHAGADFRLVEHALFKEKGKTFYWSYSTMGFFEGNERLDKNFSSIEHGK